MHVWTGFGLGMAEVASIQTMGVGSVMGRGQLRGEIYASVVGGYGGRLVVAGLARYRMFHVVYCS